MELGLGLRMLWSYHHELPVSQTTFLPQLIPLFLCLGAGVAMSALYTLRLAVKNPDVTWKHVANPEPQKEWADRQYKVRL